uniref:3-phosphoinositide-dependent protein kinase 1-like n=1 Tax=Styela clava TaxID=7725 RepID=UPI00193AB8CF|nr:3-phosphoinositide-dependent protein kinase 1-like [Styela clava]
MAEGVTDQTPKKEIKKCRSDFRFGQVLGEGSYSTVILAEEKTTKKEFAIKIIQKRHIMKERKTAHVMREKECLKRLNHPFFIKLYFTFQDEENLYFGLSVAKKGELLDCILAAKKFDFVTTRFYAGELVAALEHMHSINIIHRDLKPENVLLDDNYHIQITDFGTAKVIEDGDLSTTRTSSFVGTAQYVSPELLKEKQACKASDLWALGCIIHQMHCGKPPFQAQNEYLTFQLILKCQYEFPEIFHEDVKDIVERLIVIDPQARLGSSDQEGYPSLKSHIMFEGVDWENIANQPAPKIMASLQKISNGQQQTNIHELVDDFDHAMLIDATGTTQSSKTSEDQLSSCDPSDTEGFGLSVNLPETEKQNWMEKQKSSKWHSFCKGKLILKRGMMEKKRGLSVKLRQFILTEGPRLIYVDPVSLQQKGEIPWSEKLSVELKTFRIFYVHTPNRTYHLIDKSNNAIKWCKKIQEVSRHYFGNSEKGNSSS